MEQIKQTLTRDPEELDCGLEGAAGGTMEVFMDVWWRGPAGTEFFGRAAIA